MPNISIGDLILSAAFSLMLVYVTLSISEMRRNIASQSDYQIRRDTLLYSPTEIMYEEIRFLDGMSIDTTNVWRRDVSEFE